MSKLIDSKRCFGVECAIFENEKEGKLSKSYKFQKSFKDKDGNWKNTDFLFESDLPNMLVLLNNLTLDVVKSKQIKSKDDEF